MKDEKAGKLRTEYEKGVKAICETCRTEVETAREVWLNAKHQANHKRDEAIQKLHEELYPRKEVKK